MTSREREINRLALEAGLAGSMRRNSRALVQGYQFDGRRMFMSDGLRRLIAQATEEPLPFRVSMYCGQVMVSGRIAPPDWFFQVTKKGFEEEVWEALRRVKNSDERKAKYIDLAGPTSNVLAEATEPLDESGVDEVTLVDANIFPAVSTQGTKSGGHILPVARIPFSAIDVWWIISGETIKGRNGTALGFGFLFPVGT
jgi:hypothetical protein